MKIHIEKKKLKRAVYIFLILLFFGSLLLIYLFQEKNLRFDKYGEYSSECTIEKSFNGVVLKCNALIEGIEIKNKDEVCLRTLILFDDRKPEYLMICERNEIISGLDNEAVHSEYKIPIDLNIKYSKYPLLQPRFESVSVSLMDDKEIGKILRKLFEKNIFIKDVLSQADAKLHKDNYFSALLDIPNNEKIWYVLFLNVRINEIISENEIVLDINLSDSKIQPRAKYLKSTKDISKDIKYQAVFVYVPNNIELETNDKSLICNSEDNSSTSLKEFCESNISLESIKIDKDINEYLLDGDSSNLMLLELIPNE